MTVENQDAGNTTVATDPVQAAPQAAPQLTPQVPQSAEPVNENGGIEAQLAEFLASQRKETTPDEPTSERPTGGVNDLTADDVADPNAKRLIALLDTHYPNLDRERIIGRALEYGDPDLIDANYLRDQVGDLARYLPRFL